MGYPAVETHQRQLDLVDGEGALLSVCAKPLEKEIILPFLAVNDEGCRSSLPEGPAPCHLTWCGFTQCWRFWPPREGGKVVNRGPREVGRGLDPSLSLALPLAGRGLVAKELRLDSVTLEMDGATSAVRRLLRTDEGVEEGIPYEGEQPTGHCFLPCISSQSSRVAVPRRNTHTLLSVQWISMTAPTITPAPTTTDRPSIPSVSTMPLQLLHDWVLVKCPTRAM
jgi:hypothetical protein